jgi:Fe-S oxidoreductase
VDQAHQAVTGADGEAAAAGLIATACPFCMTMIEDGLAARDTGLSDRDIAELVVEAMGLFD